MTGLIRTDLPTSRKVELAASAFARQAEHGAKTQLARSFGISRPTVYTAASTAAEVLERPLNNLRLADPLADQSNAGTAPTHTHNLHEAKKELRSHAEYSAPFHWAAFGLTGIQ